MLRFPHILFVCLVALVSVKSLAQVSLDLGGANGGALVVGESTTTCDSTTKGGVRWNDTDSEVEMCNETDWKDVIVDECDGLPVSSDFTNQTSLSTSTLTTSNIVQITGMDASCTATISVSGTGGSPEYRVCSDSGCSTEVQTWTSSSNDIAMQDNYVQLRATTSGSADTAFVITLDIASVTSDWVLSTGEADCGAIGSVCSDGSIYAGIYSGSTPFYVTRCNAGEVWDGSSCDGESNKFAWNELTSVGETTTSTGLSDGKTNTATLVSTDSDSARSGTQVHNAAQFCDNLVHHGKSDWYLPSVNEMDTIFANKTAIGNLHTTAQYWTSSEFDIDEAYRYYMNSGAENDTGKHYTYYVRCARR